MNYLIHYAEIALKGKNRPDFEKRLVENIKASVGADKIERQYGRILLHTGDKKAKEKLKKIFGIANFLPGVRFEIDEDIDKIAQDAVNLLNEPTFKWDSFKVVTNRGNKKYQLNSQEFSARVGAQILKKEKGKKVSLKNPDKTVYFDIGDKMIFAAVEKINGPGGLPVGSSGKVVMLLSSGIDSPVASWLLAKRGAPVTYVHFHSVPYTKADSIENTKEIVKKLKDYQVGSKLFLVPFGEIQKKMILEVPERLRVVFYRRFMVRIAEEIAKKEKALALSTGENLGQVASQTVENIAAIDEAAAMPILRPLIGFNKSETIDLAKEIGTYEISIRPYEDCCTLFVPSNPETKAKLAEVLEIEKKLPVGEWVNEALKSLKEERI